MIYLPVLHPPNGWSDVLWWMVDCYWQTVVVGVAYLNTYTHATAVAGAVFVGRFNGICVYTDISAKNRIKRIAGMHMCVVRVTRLTGSSACPIAGSQRECVYIVGSNYRCILIAVSQWWSGTGKLNTRSVLMNVDHIACVTCPGALGV